ncbi:MAG: hypothetical protein ABL893_14715, partial [Hyphomicrobium sp.]
MYDPERKAAARAGSAVGFAASCAVALPEMKPDAIAAHKHMRRQRRLRSSCSMFGLNGYTHA